MLKKFCRRFTDYYDLLGFKAVCIAHCGLFQDLYYEEGYYDRKRIFKG